MLDGTITVQEVYESELIFVSLFRFMSITIHDLCCVQQEYLKCVFMFINMLM